MEGELGFLSPARPSRVSSEAGHGCGFGSPTRASPLGTLLDSPSSSATDGRGVGNGGFGFSSPIWGSPQETLLNSPSSCVSDSRIGGTGSGSRSPTRGSSLETLFKSPSSCASDSRLGGSRSGFSSPTWRSPLETLFNSPSSSVSDSHGGGRGTGFGFSTPKQASPLLNSLSSCVSDSRGCGNSSSPRLSKERESDVQKAERLLRAITERYNDCFLRLRDATADLAELRRERARLGAENLHLCLLLEELEAAEQSKQASVVALLPPPPPPPKHVQAEAASGIAPKSISIRSKGFLLKKQPLGVATPPRLLVRASQGVEDAGEKDDGEVEVEVEAFRQGAVKTELCNKWERGGCPYDARCRFAHGMGELRPVIRHPRYKTLPCQLFAGASGCPYGHRCHFRHSLPPSAESC
ncbi:hypothetical protein BS78_01G382800 [Paspalum vaginatum]|nr:hypothetical protein BS78_01G382800 [Paspalum vaginatum]